MPKRAQGGPLYGCVLCNRWFPGRKAVKRHMEKGCPKTFGKGQRAETGVRS
jgi:hypothetical protein